MKRWMIRIALGLLVLVAGTFVAMKVASDDVPEGEQGDAADALARSVQQAVNLDAWNATGAVSWSFSGRHQHLWDRLRSFHRVRWEEHEVMLDLRSQQGCAWTDGQLEQGDQAQELVQSAYAKWVNDAFWLNPIGKFFDPGVQRRKVDDEGEPALLITFTKNGLTPGDSYLWLLDPEHRPTAWRMWTMIPIGGLKASWEDWTQLPTGAWISTKHDMFGFSLQMQDVRAAATLPELEGVDGDPFARCDRLRVAYAQVHAP